MKQRSVDALGFQKYRKKTRKEQFLEEMETIIPWKELCEALELYCSNPQGAGRKPKGLEKMRRIHLLQHGFDLSDPGAEASLYDSRTMRHFVGIDLGDELFQRVNADLAENGVKAHLGVDSKTKLIHSVAVTPTNVAVDIKP